jgi:dethiobiotin synthetase
LPRGKFRADKGMNPLSPISIPGLLVVGTDTGVGKTLVAGAVAQWFGRRGRRVAVCKPCGTGCVHRREGLVSEDAEFLAHCADTRHPLDLVCPQRYAEPLAPAVAAERAGQPLDWPAIETALQTMSRDAQVIIVEGIGGIMTPMEGKWTFLDVAEWIGLPAIVVARPNLGTINHTLLTLAALRSRGVTVAGVVINRYPPETPGLAEETNPRAIERWGKAPVLCLVPETSGAIGPRVPDDAAAAIDAVDWAAIGGED